MLILICCTDFYRAKFTFSHRYLEQEKVKFSHLKLIFTFHSLIFLRKTFLLFSLFGCFVTTLGFAAIFGKSELKMVNTIQQV